MTRQNRCCCVVAGASSVEFASGVNVEESVVFSGGSESAVDDSCSTSGVFDVEDDEGMFTESEMGFRGVFRICEI